MTTATPKPRVGMGVIVRLRLDTREGFEPLVAWLRFLCHKVLRKHADIR